VGFSKKNFKKNFGFAQIPILIGLAIMIMVLPLGVRLVQERQDIRKSAAGKSAPGCDGGDSGRTYGECCGCKMTREVRECTRPDGTKYWRTGGCVIPNSVCQDGCSPDKPTPTPTPSGTTTCAGGKKPGELACLDADHCKLCQDNGLYTDSNSCDCPQACRPSHCSGALPTPTPTPCRCVNGIYQGDLCDGWMIGKPCGSSLTPTPTPTPTRVCQPYETQCVPPSSVHVCSESGQGWVELTNCREGWICPLGEKVCRAPAATSTPRPTSTPTPEPRFWEHECLTADDCEISGRCHVSCSGWPRRCHWEVCPIFTPTSTPTLTPTSDCRCVNGIYQGETCDGWMIGKPCGSSLTPTPTPKQDSCPGQCKYICNPFDEKNLGIKYCSDFGKRCCVKDDSLIEPTPTPTPCRCVNGIYQGGSCESWMVGTSCDESKSKPMCAYRNKTYFHLDTVCSSESELLTCNSGRWVSTICSTEGKVCSEGRCQEITPVETPVRQECRSLGGVCRLSLFGCGEGRVVNNNGICGFGQNCCVAATKDCGSLGHGETVCEGRGGYKICLNGSIKSYSCENGLFCQYVKGEGAKCLSPLVSTPTPEPASECLCQDGFMTGNCPYNTLGKACGAVIEMPTPYLLPVNLEKDHVSCSSGSCIPENIGCGSYLVSVGECESSFGRGVCCDIKEYQTLPTPISEALSPTPSPQDSTIPLPSGLEDNRAITDTLALADKHGVVAIVMYEGFTHSDPQVVEDYNAILNHLKRNNWVATTHEDMPESVSLGKKLGCYPNCQFWNLGLLQNHSSGGCYPYDSIDRVMTHEKIHNMQEQKNPGVAENLSFYNGTSRDELYRVVIETRAEKESGNAAGCYNEEISFYDEIEIWAQKNGYLENLESASWGDYEALEGLCDYYQQLEGESLEEKWRVAKNQKQ
jgi:hypothetical protein